MTRNASGHDSAAASPATPDDRPSPSATPSAALGGEDVVLLGPPTADGEGVHVLRARDERVEAGELRALREGRPVTGEIVSLKPREGNPRICDVKESYDPQAGDRPTRKGPAQIATKAYRENWDEIFAKAEPAPPGPAPRPDPRTLN